MIEKTLKFALLLSISTVMLYSCKSGDKLPVPEIKAGAAKLSGRLIYNFPTELKDQEITLTVCYPVTSSTKEYTFEVSKDGFFHSDDIALETNYAIAFLNINTGQCENVIIGLKEGRETKLEIYCDSVELKHINATQPIALTSSDMLHSADVMTDMITGNHPFRKRAPEERLYEKNPDYFIQYSLKLLNHREEIADHNERLSEPAKQILKNDFKFFLAKMQFFNYKEMLYINYLNTNEGKGKAGFDSLNIPEPDKSYYSFLKALKPNDPLLLYSSEYSNCLQAILQNDTLSIPLIEDTPIEKWLDGVKKTMADLVGFDKGLFYDMLAANAYAKQFNDRVQPLSEKQKQNIQDYFKNSSFVEILLKKSEETEKVSALASGLKINETPTLPDGRQIEAWYRENSIKPPTGKLIDTIVSRYRGKVTVIDFWATWCAPCMSAISESRELKAEMKDRNVVFVYITNSSSPKETWQQKIPGIGGEHYYLSNKRDWESITYSEKYGLDYIPTYLIFDAEGNLKHKFTSYPGNDRFRELIEDLL